MSSKHYNDIKKILIARTVVETGSFQKAAKELKVTPSAISQSIAQLEKKMGGSLFIRDQGSLTATSKCLTLIEKAKPAIEALDSLFSEGATAEHKELVINYLDIGANESLAVTILDSFVSRLKEDFPDVRVQMVVGRSSDLVKKIKTGELCSALIAECDGMERLRKIEIAKDEFGIFISSKFSDYANDWNFISKLGFGVLSSGSDGHPRYLKKFIQQLGAKPKISMTSDSFEVLKKAAAGGLTASILPTRIVHGCEPDLVQLSTINGANLREKGAHSIYFIGMERCDEVEAKYLSELARKCLLHSSYKSS